MTLAKKEKKNDFEHLSGTSRRWISTPQRWNCDSRERRDVGLNVDTLPCFYEHERSRFQIPHTRNLNTLSGFCRFNIQTSSNLVPDNFHIPRRPKSTSKFENPRVLPLFTSFDDFWILGESRYRFDFFLVFLGWM